jgi:hypothetical protein
MRLLTYERAGMRRLGAWVDGLVVDLPDAVGHPAFPRTMEELVAHHGGTTLAAARDALESPEIVRECTVAHPHVLAALLPEALCEAGGPAGDGAGDPSPILGPGDVVPWPRRARGLRCQVELACVVGDHGTRLTSAEAGRRLFGTTLLVSWCEADDGPDGSDARRTAISVGPTLVTCDEPDPSGALVEVLVRGRTRAAGVLHRGRAPFAQLVAEASQIDGVAPGEIFGGSAFGAVLTVPLGAPDRGAVVEVSVDGVGTLRTRLARSPLSVRRRGASRP